MVGRRLHIGVILELLFLNGACFISFPLILQQFKEASAALVSKILAGSPPRTAMVKGSN